MVYPVWCATTTAQRQRAEFRVCHHTRVGEDIRHQAIRLSQHNQLPLAWQGSESRMPFDSEVTLAGHWWRRCLHQWLLHPVTVCHWTFPVLAARYRSHLQASSWMHRDMDCQLSCNHFERLQSHLPRCPTWSRLLPTLSPHCLHGNGRCSWVAILCHLPEERHLRISVFGDRINWLRWSAYDPKMTDFVTVEARCLPSRTHRLFMRRWPSARVAFSVGRLRFRRHLCFRWMELRLPFCLDKIDRWTWRLRQEVPHLGLLSLDKALWRAASITLLSVRVASRWSFNDSELSTMPTTIRSRIIWSWRARTRSVLPNRRVKWCSCLPFLLPLGIADLILLVRRWYFFWSRNVRQTYFWRFGRPLFLPQWGRIPQICHPPRRQLHRRVHWLA